MLKVDMPKVSCCLCTYDRYDLFKKSVDCYCAQTYPNKELIIVTEGPRSFKNKVSALLEIKGRDDIFPVFLDGDRTLGEVRNISLKKSTGDLYCQWDDDDFNHPKRLAIQIKKMLDEKAFACFLQDQFHYYWEDNALYWEKWAYKDAPERCNWIPGTIIMKMNDRYKYPETGAKSRASEDVVLVDQLWLDYLVNGLQITKLSDYGYLHIYSFHGTKENHKNTFDKNHHMWLSTNCSQSINYMLKNRELIEQSLNLINIKRNIKIMGKEGLAFNYNKGEQYV